MNASLLGKCNNHPSTIKSIASFLVTCWRGFATNSLPPRRPIVILETDLEEKFVKGSGAGGQKINKTSSAVQLFHKPTGIRVETQRFRGLADNRKEARKLLKLRLDEMYNGDQSKIALKIAKIQKQKAKQKSRVKKKNERDQEGNAGKMNDDEKDD